MNPVSLLFVCSCLAFVLELAADGAPPTAKPESTKSATPHNHDYFKLNGGLQNSRIRFERKKTGRVAFLGGSITNMKGWREMTYESLKQRFPGTKFDFVHAGIPDWLINFAGITLFLLAGKLLLPRLMILIRPRLAIRAA